MKKKIYTIIVLFSLVVVLTGCNKKNVISTNSEPVNRKILVVVSPAQFNDQEYSALKNIFVKFKYEIKIASIQTGQTKSDQGQALNIDALAAGVNAKDYDAVIFVGGQYMDQLAEDDSLKSLAVKFKNENKLVAAIDNAQGILLNTNMIKEVNHGGTIIVDHLIITAADASQADSFASNVYGTLTPPISN